RMTEGQSRPPLASHDTFEHKSLSGKLSHDGLAALSADQPAASNGTALRPAKTTESRDFGTRSESAVQDEKDDGSDDTIEDYDDIELDPDTMVANSRKSLEEVYRPATGNSDREKQGDTPNVTSPPTSPSKHRKRNSIQIRLERTDKKGRYILTADDPEIKDILRKGIEREEVEAGNKKPPRMRIRDLVFTRQFTTFDRQNPTSSESPFFGFFTLFWIAMVLMFVRVSMSNYREYGSILGSNQIMKMMFSHDVFVLGITDGVMCGSAILEG
ncbi:hypothetical protein KC355_g21922, partial [Hortaea werneckii]